MRDYVEFESKQADSPPGWWDTVASVVGIAFVLFLWTFAESIVDWVVALAE